MDDSADMRKCLQRILSQRWKVDLAADGKEALALVRNTRPDLIVTDRVMPELDGLALVRALRDEPHNSSTPVIMLSASAGDESRDEGIAAGADDYLVKPFSPSELVSRVGTHLELSRLRCAAELDQAKLSSLLMDAPATIAVMRGPEHVFELANSRYLRLANRTDILGRTVRAVFPELEGQGFFELLDRVYRTGEPSIQNEARLVFGGSGSGNNGEVFFNCVYQAYFASDGTVKGISFFGFEVTEQVRARKEAESANRAKDEFLAVLGHELRNPLAPILTAVQLMRLRGVGAAEKERTVIERQARHLIRLVDDLLDVSRITRGKVELKKQRLEVAAVIAKAIEMASPLLEHRKHDLVADVAPSGLAIDADPERLGQVISNLLTNAIKYTEPGGRITITATRTADEVIVRVRDTGIGITGEMLPTVFDMFVQERQALDRSQGGLGLGLMIVRSLVTLHGGRVDACSEGLGRGSEFTVRLPAAARQESAAPPALAGAPRVPDRCGASRSVLLVDDNADAAEMMAASLEFMGHTTRVAHDGVAALDLVRDFVPDIALLDIGLPVMDGYELARRLHEQQGLQRLPLVALTGYGHEAARQRSTAAGFRAHLVKPTNAERVESVIQELTAGKAFA